MFKLKTTIIVHIIIALTGLNFAIPEPVYAHNGRLRIVDFPCVRFKSMEISQGGISPTLIEDLRTTIHIPARSIRIHSVFCKITFTTQAKSQFDDQGFGLSYALQRTSPPPPDPPGTCNDAVLPGPSFTEDVGTKEAVYTFINRVRFGSDPQQDKTVTLTPCIFPLRGPNPITIRNHCLLVECQRE